MCQTEFDLTSDPDPERYFLGWDRPLVESVSQWLLDLGDALSRTLVVVPTANSGRRLRMSLSAVGGGVLSPHVMVPSKLFEVEGVASRQESLWAWIKVIQRINVGDFPHLLPNHVPGSNKGFRAALALSKQLMSLRDQLADGDASFRDAGFHSLEKERWEELGSLETAMLQQLGEWKLRDSVLAKRAKAKSPELPPGVNNIVLACVPDPTPLAQRVLKELLNKGLPVTVLIHAPESEADGFDGWGVPQKLLWCHKTIGFPEWKKRFHVVDSSSDAASECVKLISQEETESNEAALILCDPTFSTAMKASFREVDWSLFDPEGESLNSSGFTRLIQVAGELTRSPAPFSALQDFVRLPGAEPLLPQGLTRHEAASFLDELQLKNLPERVQDARRLTSSDEAIQVIDSVMRQFKGLQSASFLEILRSWLVSWLELTDSEVKGTAEVVEPYLVEAFDALERLQSANELPYAPEVFEMLVEALRSAKTSLNRDETALDLQGWLEVSYDPAPHLLLAGMHEGCVPDGAVDDLFIPNSLRQKLGLRDSDGRYARDCFLLQGALRSRDAEGRVDVIVSRFTDSGEARKPSRLLMRARREELPSVVKHLFAESTSNVCKSGAWQRDWELNLPDVENPYAAESPRKVSPSALGDYLFCPLRFYLRRVLHMQRYESGKQEMNALDFGNRCHEVLDCFGRDDAIRDSTDADEIRDYLTMSLDRVVEKWYGDDLSLPLMVQLESARERIRAFADAQAKDRADGWMIVETELAIGRLYNSLDWQLGGHPMTMIIDRVDRHEDGNRWRVWDYKTSGKASSPEMHHLKRWDEDENRPLLADLFIPQGRKVEHRWASLQLPLYAAFVQQRFETSEVPQVGYINLPRALGEVGFSPWKDFDQALLDNAMAWGEAGIEAIRSGAFGQVASLARYERDWDEFAELSPDGLAAAFGI